MVTLSSSSKSSKSSAPEISVAVRSSGGSLTRVLKAVCAFGEKSPDVLPGVQLVAQLHGVSLVGKGRADWQIVEPVVDWGG